MKYYLPSCCLITGLLLIHFFAFAVYQENIPVGLTQPDGTELYCLASGDEFFNYLHDAEGFTILQGESGFYYYAVVEEATGSIIASAYRADSTNPHSTGLEKSVLISPEEYQKRVNEFMLNVDKSVRAPATGQITNLVVYIRFSDDDEFDGPRQEFDNNFNNPSGPSLRHYFNEVSYQQLDIESHHFPISEMSVNLSYQDDKPRGYYQPYCHINNPMGYYPGVPTGHATDTMGRTFRQHTLLVSAINAIASQVPSSLEIDANNNGKVDNVSFIIRGEQGTWNTLLWAHRWTLWSQNVTINGKRVYDFTFQPETQSSIYVLCHEMFHILGAPDLYRYSQDGFTPVGPWDIMHSGFVHMGAYMKHKYSDSQWVEQIPLITQPGTYTLNPLYSQHNIAFRIPGPAGSREYFVVEYRKRYGHYEVNIPGEGLLFYRIFPNANGNITGPPDGVYIFRPQGNLTQNGNVFEAHFSPQAGRNEFHDHTDPGGFMGDGSPAGIHIDNIGIAGQTLTFDLVPTFPGVMPPENLVANVSPDYHVVLEWDLPPVDNQNEEAPQLEGYQVFRNNEMIAQLTDPQLDNYTDSSPPAGTYEYFLRAVYSDPEAVSFSTDPASAVMPGYFSVDQGTDFITGWQAGSIELDISSNVSHWETLSSESWLQVDPPSGNFGQQILLWYSANKELDERTARLALTSGHDDTEILIEVQQQSHITLVENHNNPGFELFPNPATSGRLTLSFQQHISKGHVSLFSMDGRKITDQEINESTGYLVILNTQNLESGIYLLFVQVDQQSFRKKVVIL